MTAGEKAQQGLTAQAGPGIDANQIRYGLGIGGEGGRKWTGWLQGHPLGGCIAGWSLQEGWGVGTRREGTEQEVAEAIAGELGLTDRTQAVRPEFPAPCGCGLWLWAAGCGAAANQPRQPPNVPVSFAGKAR